MGDVVPSPAAKPEGVVSGDVKPAGVSAEFQAAIDASAKRIKEELSEMVTGAVARNIGEAFGAKKGENVIDVLKRSLVPPAPAQPNLSEIEAKAAKEQAAAAEAKAAEAIKGQSAAVRKAAVIEALAAFGVRKDVQSFVTEAFVSGSRAGELKVDDAGKLLAAKDNAAATEFFGAYFKENPGLLEVPMYKGAGGRGADPSARVNGATIKGGKDYGKSVAEISKNQGREAALDAMDERAETLRKSLEGV